MRRRTVAVLLAVLTVPVFFAMANPATAETCEHIKVKPMPGKPLVNEEVCLPVGGEEPPPLPLPDGLPPLPGGGEPPTVPPTLPPAPPTDPNALPGYILTLLLGTLPPGTIPPPAIDGVQTASATPGSASAAVIDIPGVVTVGKSESSKTGSRVTVLSVGGQDLLVREGTADGGTYAGPLAPAGDAIDQVNAALCPAGPANTAPTETGCVVLLYSDATTDRQTGTSRTNSAQFRAVSITTPDGANSLTVGSTSASTTRTPFFGTTRCTDVATSFLLSGRGPLAAIILLNPGGPAFAISPFKTC